MASEFETDAARPRSVQRSGLALGSGRAEAVEKVAVVGPLGIAEVGPTHLEWVRCHGGPVGMGEVRADVQHHIGISGSRHDEAEAVGLHTKVGTTGQDQRLRKRPSCCRTTAERRNPARGARQVVDGRRGRKILLLFNAPVIEDMRTNTGGGVSPEVDARQIRTPQRTPSIRCC